MPIPGDRLPQCLGPWWAALQPCGLDNHGQPLRLRVRKSLRGPWALTQASEGEDIHGGRAGHAGEAGRGPLPRGQRRALPPSPAGLSLCPQGSRPWQGLRMGEFTAGGGVLPRRAAGSPAAPHPQSASHGVPAAGRGQGSPAPRPSPARPGPAQAPARPGRAGRRLSSGSPQRRVARPRSPAGSFPGRGRDPFLSTSRQSTGVLPPSPRSRSRRGEGAAGCPEDTGLPRLTRPWQERDWCRSSLVHNRCRV